MCLCVCVYEINGAIPPLSHACSWCAQLNLWWWFLDVRSSGKDKPLEVVPRR